MWDKRDFREAVSVPGAGMGRGREGRKRAERGRGREGRKRAEGKGWGGEGVRR